MNEAEDNYILRASAAEMCARALIRARAPVNGAGHACTLRLLFYPEEGEGEDALNREITPGYRSCPENTAANTLSPVLFVYATFQFPSAETTLAQFRRPPQIARTKLPRSWIIKRKAVEKFRDKRLRRAAFDDEEGKKENHSSSLPKNTLVGLSVRDNEERIDRQTHFDSLARRSEFSSHSR